jgi:hypothetical protein
MPCRDREQSVGVVLLVEVSGQTGSPVMMTQEDSWAREKEQTSPMLRLPKIIPLRSAHPWAEVLPGAGLPRRQ